MTHTTRAVAVYAAVTTAVSALLWLVGARSASSLAVAALPISALMFVAPGVGAVVAHAWAQRHRGLLRTVPRGTWSEGARLIPRPLLTMPVAVLAAALLERALGETAPDPAPTWQALATVAAGLVVSGAVEQVGWTWFLRRALGNGWSRLVPTLMIGLFWAGLHVIPWLQAGRSVTWVLGQAALSLALRALIVDVVAPRGRPEASERAGVVIATTVHASYNIAWVTLPVLGLGYSPWLTAAATVAIVLARRTSRATKH